MARRRDINDIDEDEEGQIVDASRYVMPVVSKQSNVRLILTK